MIEHMKKLKESPLMRILLLLFLICAIVFFFVMDARNFAPKRITRRNEQLGSEQIPRQMNNVNILFFSDLEYGTFMDEERLNALCTAIDNAGADIILFGGDMFDYEAQADAVSISLLTEKLRSLNAPLGKFAVLGDNDHKNEETAAAVASILSGADFELLSNRSVLLHNRDSRSITLVGLDNGLNGIQDIEAAYANVSPASYVITVCHTPDTASKVPADKTDYFLAGHSHGGQVYYFFGASYTPAMATEYMRGKHLVGTDFTLDITNGVGTTGTDARFLSSSEIVLYTLASYEPEPTPTPAPSLSPAPQPEETPAAETPQPEEQQSSEEAQEPAAEEIIPEESGEEYTGEEETWDESGEWTDESGEWTDESGEWTDESGEWTDESGEWTDESGEWTDESGEWTDESGEDTGWN